MKRTGTDPVFASLRLIPLVSLALGCRLALATTASTIGSTPYSVRIWQTDDGLPQNSVHAIAQTADGFLWVGTHEGLARFDGVRFTLIDDKTAPELKRGWITALCVSRDGSLWIAVDGQGLSRLKNGAFSHFSQPNGLPGNQTRCLFEGQDGSLWIGGEAGLTRFKDGKFTTFTARHGLGDDSVRAICEDGEGAIRVATKRGLSTLINDGVTGTVNFGSGAAANALKSVCKDAQGDLWVGSNDGLHRLENQKPVSYGVSDGLPDKVSTVVYGDHRGQLYVGTYGGLARVNQGKIVPMPLGEAASGDRIYAIFEDQEENLWVGAWDGLYRLTPRRFTTYTTQHGLTFNNVMSVLEDSKGAIWMGTWGGGLNRMLEDTITSFRTTNGLTHDSVLALHEGRDGSLWVGMDFDGGLNRFKEGQRTAFSRANGLINAAIRVIHEDRQGALWIGTSLGVNVFKNGKFRTLTPAQGLAGLLVMALCEDRAGTIWVGADGGLSRWDGAKFTTYTTQDGLSQNAINALYEDEDGNLWIGTRSGGLNRFRAGKFTAYTTKEGLFNDEIYEIVEDDLGCFWMSCRKGIFRVNKKDLDEFDRGGLKTIPCISFGKADGLVSIQCNGVAKPAGWKSRDGRIWFPTIRGVVAVECGIPTNEKPPPVVIEEVRADQQTLRGGLDSSDSLAFTVPPGRGGFEIHYTALSFQAPEKNRFKYRLEGIDSGWIDAGGDRTARYYNLAPRRYRFHVIACNNDGVWNETGAAVALTLQPHAWQTWWFKLAILAAVGLLLGAFYRSRLTRLRAIENLRVQIAADLHDDVGARLTKVAMVTELVDGDTPATDRNKPHIKNISRTTREIVRAMDEIVWTINPKNDTLDHLANYIFQYAQEYFQNSGVRCRMDLPAGLPEQRVSTEERHNLFMAVKEALNNVLKHAGATEVRIGLAVTDAKLTILIADNGRGFSTDQAHPSGEGLNNMKQRLARIGGRLMLESRSGSGTTVRLEANGQ